MFIQTESTPNEDSLKFIPGTPVMGEGSAEFLDTRAALVSPLAIRLMGIQGVTGVFYGPDFVTVSKDSENPWNIGGLDYATVKYKIRQLSHSQKPLRAAAPQVYSCRTTQPSTPRRT